MTLRGSGGFETIRSPKPYTSVPLRKKIRKTKKGKK